MEVHDMQLIVHLRLSGPMLRLNNNFTLTEHWIINNLWFSCLFCKNKLENKQEQFGKPNTSILMLQDLTSLQSDTNF